ncbi:prefoldin subunit alpha [Candidatus Thorarchaeota archaeon]|nr:MAG: prefoldin subunit alpha [Candidatus Thorarchaeota archaeon]
MSEDQQKLLQRVYTEQQMTESNISLLAQRMELIQAYLNNYQAGLMVLNEIEGKNEGEEMLINVGGSIFIQARILEPSKVTRGIGSGVRIEQSLEDAKIAVQEQLSSLQKQYDVVIDDYQKLLTRARVLNAQFQELAAKMQEQED